MQTIFFTAISVIFFTTLLVFGYLGQASYLFLIALIALISIVVQLFPRLKELDLKNLRLVLQEIKDTKADIYAREDDLKKISYLTILILSYSTVTQGRMGSKESIELQRKWFQKNLGALAKALKYTDSEEFELSKYINKYNEFDSLLAGRDSLQSTDPGYKDVKAKLNTISEELNNMLREDIASET